MIIRRVFNIATAVRRNFYSLGVNLPLMNFQEFFKEVQKATETKQAIKVYNSFIKQQGKYEQYLAITLRILTRLIKTGQNDDPQTVKQFLNANLQKVKSIDIKKISTQYIKDIIFFYIGYHQQCQLRTHEKDIIQNYLKEFIVRFQSADNKDRVLFSSITISSLRFTHTLFPELNTILIKHSIDLFEQNPSVFFQDNFQFHNILKTFHHFQYYNNEIKTLIYVFLNIFKQTYQLTTFSQITMVQLLSGIIRVKSKTYLQPPLLNIMTQIEQKLQSSLLRTITKIRILTFQFLIPQLLKYKRKSVLLKTYFNLINNSVGSTGHCKINPQVIIFTLALLTKKDVQQFLSTSFIHNFIQMMKIYFKIDNDFSLSMRKQLVQIINQGILNWSQVSQLYKYCFVKQGLYLKYKKFNQLPKQLILLSFIHALFYKKQNILACLILANKNLPIFKQQHKSYKYKNKYSSDNWRNSSIFFDTRQFLCSIIQSQVTQMKLLKKDQEYKNIDLLYQTKRKTKFNTQFICLLLVIKIKLSYLNISYTQTQNTFKQFPSKKITNNYNKTQLAKYIIFRSNFAKIHYQLVVDFMMSLFTDHQQIHNIFKNTVLKAIDQFKITSKNYTDFVYYYYKKYFPPSQFTLILIEHPHLLIQLLKIYPQQAINYILDYTMNNPNLNQKYYLAYKTTIYYAGQYFQDKQQAQILFKKISSIAKTIFKQLHYTSNQLVNILASYTFQTFIFKQTETQYIMDQLIHSLNLTEKLHSYSTIKQIFLSNYHPSFLKLIELNRKLNIQQMSQYYKIVHQCVSQNRKQQALLAKLYQKIILQNFVSKFNIYKNLLIYLKNFTLKYIKFAQYYFILRNGIKLLADNSFFTKQFNCDFYEQLSDWSDYSDYFSYLAYYPIIKTQNTFFHNIQGFGLYPVENIGYFCMIYSLIEQPSHQIRQFMINYTLKCSQNIPHFFKIYLSHIEYQWASSLKVVNYIKDEFSLLTQQKQEILICQDQLVKLFTRDKLSVKNWRQIETGEQIDGCHRLIIKKIISTLHPTKLVRFKTNSHLKSTI